MPPNTDHLGDQSHLRHAATGHFQSAGQLLVSFLQAQPEALDDLSDLERLAVAAVNPVALRAAENRLRQLLREQREHERKAKPTAKYPTYSAHNTDF